MPRSYQRSVLLANIVKMMEQLIRLIKHVSGKVLIELLEELWMVYKVISARRYMGCSVGIWLAQANQREGQGTKAVPRCCNCSYHHPGF
ncbi:hypothetical protein L211DRAFT_74684 [Terfezia boudieri ATCC MYA-4762]|uniref:Uncharacterized protein n=1 Tax=Terfezia boudieri ATCC MYA-4762 TaxID=1051890 RepID=A0A3N4LWJ3_9PEZI|nr:hypothetical protein L211DRAFT_74684 [Terfezia boudieri ATCC MYA-4762]